MQTKQQDQTICDDNCHGGAPYVCVVADPPWKMGDSLPGKTRGASKQYVCLPVHEIMRFPLPAIADDAILFLWRLSAMPQEALDVLKAWGFKPKSEIVWEKLTKTGKPWMGMGRYVRAAHETCLVATRGRFKVASKSVRSRFSAKVPVGPDGKYIHSAKPDEFYAIVEALVNGQKVEMFARRRRPGWCARGNELPAGDCK
jgi:N6-adenosine-specific RNA methylase IME4